MSATSYPVGVSAVLLPVVGSSALPSFATLTFSASSTALTTLDNNSGKSSLDSTATYQVALTAMGVDVTNGGYTMGPSTVSSGNLALTTAQGIKVSATSGALAALGGSVAELFCIGVWLKIGAANFQLTDLAYVDPSTDFVHTVVTKPRRTNLTKTFALLSGSASDDDLGDRNPHGCAFRATPTTTGGVILNRTGDKVSFSPDTAGNFDVKTTRTVSIEFSVLSGDLRDVVGANAGTYTRYTHSAIEYEEAQMSEFTTAVSVPGCKPLIMVHPPDKLGFQAITLFVGQVLQNQADNTESYTKDNQLEVKYVFSAVPNDTLTNNMATELKWKKKQ